MSSIKNIEEFVVSISENQMEKTTDQGRKWWVVVWMISIVCGRVLFMFFAGLLITISYSLFLLAGEVLCLRKKIKRIVD